MYRQERAIREMNKEILIASNKLEQFYKPIYHFEG